MLVKSTTYRTEPAPLLAIRTVTFCTEIKWTPELTPRRKQLIDTHVAESHARMAEHAFELNDLVRFALVAAKPKGQKVYYPMDPVNECIRHWDALAKKLARLVAGVERDRARLSVAPFDAEAPVGPDDGSIPVAVKAIELSVNHDNR